MFAAVAAALAAWITAFAAMPVLLVAISPVFVAIADVLAVTLVVLAATPVVFVPIDAVLLEMLPALAVIEALAVSRSACAAAAMLARA